MLAGLAAFCRGRLHTTGLTAAALAAAAALGLDPLALDEAADARTPSPALRATARKLGRRADAGRPVHLAGARPGRARGRPPPRRPPARRPRAHRGVGRPDPEDAAYCAAYEAVGGPATAVVRLLSLDPFQATAVLARLAPELDRVAEQATAAARQGIDAL